MAKPEQPTIREAVARFGEPEKLEAVVSDLQSHGFDRADISFAAPGESGGEAAPGKGATFTFALPRAG